MNSQDIIIPKETIRRALGESLERVLGEGIDFNYKYKEVSYNPSHQNNVDTSIEANPTCDYEIVEGVPVWSVFKRKRGNIGDGNPLIYALKGELDWHFRSEEDEKAVINQFELIADKFARQYKIGVTVMVPSGNPLNKFIADRVVAKNPKAVLLEGLICKLTTEEVYEIALADNSEFRKYYGENFEHAFYQLMAFLENMNNERNGEFSRHLIKDSQMRNVLNQTFKLSPNKWAKYANVINGEDILIIDDTISRGHTIKETCRIMKESYAPRSITVLTLLSKLD